mgnify:CR=1 FL=1
MKILIVEDEKDLRTILEKRLKKLYTVDSCKDGEEALSYLDIYTYDLILLDIMLPKIDGLSVLKTLRNRKIKTPVILLTAKNMVEDRVRGLDTGADDYLIKPFAFDELLARIRVLLRRTSDNTTNTIQVGDLVLHTQSRSVTRGDKQIELTHKEYQLLEYMMHNPNIILTRNQLEQRICDQSYQGGSNLIDVYIRYLRKKIDDGFEVKMIKTIRGTGYKLEGNTNEE